jgi:hypothetical protein
MSQTSHDSAIGPEAQLTYVWNYFAVHAEQRMHLFNFFVGLAVLMTGAMVGTFHKDFTIPSLGFVLGLGLVFISFVFSKLDQRVGYLVKNAEKGLSELEALFRGALDSGQVQTQLVLNEARATESLRKERARWSPRAQYSYAQSFSLLFWFFGAIGLVGAVMSLQRWIGG